jgi:tRNA pseudouridine55 synthase
MPGIRKAPRGRAAGRLKCARQPAMDRSVMQGGILLIDKPAAVTSHDVTHALAKRFSLKAGHAGTLDRFATGLLVACMGRATRVSRYLSGLHKEYLAVAELGLVTDTYDGEGRPVSRSAVVPSAEDVESLPALFRGAIRQTPPPFSAKKIRGRRASDLARRGIRVDMAPVEIEISALRIEAYDFPSLTLRVTCSSGTYIRSLVKDMGDRLGCGAHARELRRLGVGRFRVDDAMSLENALGLEAGALESRLMDPAEALDFMPAARLEPGQSRLFLRGTAVARSGSDSHFRVFGSSGAFLGVGLQRRGLLQPETVFPAT